MHMSVISVGANMLMMTHIIVVARVLNGHYEAYYVRSFQSKEEHVSLERIQRF